MKWPYQKIQFGLIAFMMAAVVSGCRMTTLPEVTEINETVEVVVLNDFSEPIVFLEDTVPDWIDIGGLNESQLQPGQVANLTLTARCDDKEEVREAAIALRSNSGNFSKFINVQIECTSILLPFPNPFNPNNPTVPFPTPKIPIPSPTPTPTPSPSPHPEFGSLRGNPNFSVSQLSAHQRTWYNRILRSIQARNYDSAAASDNLYKYGRDLHTHYQAILLAFRATGDLRLLDELVRLTEIQRSKLHDSWRDTLDGTRQTDSYLNWVWRYDKTNKTHYGKDLNMLDEIKAHSILTVLAYAFYVNRDLTSPGGYNYRSQAEYWKNHIENQFLKKWRERNRVSPGDYRVFEKPGTHTTYSIVVMNLHLYKLTGDRGYLNEADFWTRYLWQDIVEVSAPTGPAYVWPKWVVSYRPGTSLDYLHPVVYARYVFADMVELYLDGYNNWADASNMERFARTIADFVMFNGNKSFARDVGGNVSRGGYPTDNSWVDNSRERYRVSPIAHMIAWDKSGKMRRITQEVYDIVERDPETPRELYMPVGLFVDAVWNKR
jgi:hypothetical protein